MSKLPIISGKKIIKAFNKIGYRAIRQRGKHIRLQYLGRKSITVPNYKAIDRLLLRKILRDAELTPDEFNKLL